MLELADLFLIIASSIGLFLLSKINKTYVLFVYYLLAGLITELSYYAHFNGSIKKIIIFIYLIAATQLLLSIFFSWDKNKYTLKTKILFHVIFSLIVLADVFSFYFYGIITRWGTLLIYLALSVYSINILNQHTVGFYSKKSTISRALIIVPFVVFSIYYVTISIVMYFLYNASNQIFFINLYNVVRLINILSYTCFSIALILAPKKDKFLIVT